MDSWIVRVTPELRSDRSDDQEDQHHDEQLLLRHDSISRRQGEGQTVGGMKFR